MRTRIILFILAMTMVAYGVWLTSRRGARHSPPRPAPRTTTPSTSKPEVAIQDGKTIDFSSGKPVYKDDAAEKAAITKGVAAIDAAAGNVTFPPAAASGKTAPPAK